MCILCMLNVMLESSFDKIDKNIWYVGIFDFMFTYTIVPKIAIMRTGLSTVYNLIYEI